MKARKSICAAMIALSLIFGGAPIEGASHSSSHTSTSAGRHTYARPAVAPKRVVVRPSSSKVVSRIAKPRTSAGSHVKSVGSKVLRFLHIKR